MGVAVWFAAGKAGAWMAATGWGMKARDAAMTGGGIALGLFVFTSLAWLLRIPELRDFTAALRRRVK
jgi:hypothetical protein